jgi:hypothetical protein
LPAKVRVLCSNVPVTGLYTLENQAGVAVYSAIMDLGDGKKHDVIANLPMSETPNTACVQTVGFPTYGARACAPITPSTGPCANQ